MRKYSLLSVFAVLISIFSTYSQIIVGYNNPATVGCSNDASIGTIAWALPGLVATSNDVRSTTPSGSRGITNYVKATNYGFVLPLPCPSCIVTGVETQVERRSPVQPDVAVLNNWVSMTPSSTGAGPYNFPITAASPPAIMNRALVVVIGNENGPSTPAIIPPTAGNDSRDIVSVTYGGVPMTQSCEVAFSNAASGTTFWARNEIWFLNDAGISAAVGNQIVINAPGASNEYVMFVSAISFQNVDQINPVFDFRTDTVVGAINPFALGNPAPMLQGSCAVTSVVCGNPGSYVFNAGGASGLAGVNFIEGTDVNGSGIGTSYSTSTATMMTGSAIVPNGTSGSVAPTYQFSATPNRQVIAMICVQRARDFDNEVRLVKALAVTGTSQGVGTTWPLADAYQTYGGPGNLWGTTVSLAEVTNTGFGFAVSARVQNQNVQVDHMQMRIYLTSTLPVELVDFNGERIDRDIKLIWTTSSETNNDYFELHRSSDAINYFLINTIEGAGNSNNLIEYIQNDTEAPQDVVNYYKIKQVDFNGAYKWYGPIAIDPADKGSSLSLYPNPATTTITIKDVESINNFSIYNNVGALVKSGVMENDNIDIDELVPGTYYLSIGDSGAKVKFMKF
jgi:hypothetical protein